MAVKTKLNTEVNVTGLSTAITNDQGDVSNAIDVSAAAFNQAPFFNLRVTATITAGAKGDALLEVYLIRTIGSEEEEHDEGAAASFPGFVGTLILHKAGGDTTYIGILSNILAPPSDFKIALKNVDATSITPTDIDIEPWTLEDV